MLTTSISMCLFLVLKIHEKLVHPIAISLDNPKKIDSVPFPAVTFLEPFSEQDFLQFHDWDFLLAHSYPQLKQKLFKILKEQDITDQFFTLILMCKIRTFFYEYPFEFSVNAMVDDLRNKSNERNFLQQKALWNSEFEVDFAKRLTSHGFGYSFNILDAKDVFNLEE